MFLPPVRTHDRRQGVTHVIQGEYRVSQDSAEVLTTLLGSCVATCLCDPVAGVGGMNHFLLAQGEGAGSMGYRYGLQAMELLINGLIKLGARKSRLEAKLFGGARMDHMLARIGDANAEFALQFLASEGIRCVAQSLGGTQARRVRYIPSTGHARQLLISGNLPGEDQVIRPRPLPGGDVTLFQE